MARLNGLRASRSIGVTALLLATLLVGCGTEETLKVAPSPRKVLLASVRTTVAAQSARMSMSMIMTGTGAESLEITADGVTDFATGDGVLMMQLTGIGSEFLSGGIEMRVVDGAVYIQMPESLGGMFGGGKWMKIPDLGAADQALPGLGQSDPSQFLAYLETVSADVKKVGSEPIRGVDTTHYKASLDLGKVVDRADAPPSLRDELRELFAKGNRAGSVIPADVWVDGDGLARRIKLQLDLGALVGDGLGADDPPTMSVTLDLYDFGVPVHIVAPPTDQVTTIPGLFGPSGSAS